MIEREVVVIGAGPAGLSAAIETAKNGADTLLIDENSRPGGQLFKQIHKFFGSQSHYAGMRGIDIGNQLLETADAAGVETWLDSVVWGLFEDRKLGILRNEQSQRVQAEHLVLATGAMENSLEFPGWTLAGVMTAGAAQTMVNIHRVLPGRRVLMVGSGNVGLIVAYQLLQAGADVIAVVETLPNVGGYGVHAAKLRRAGVPILTMHTILEATGKDQVEAAVIARVGADMLPIPGSEETLEVDTVCLAVGLSPMAELALMAGCEFTYIPGLGGHVPIHDDRMQTTVQGIYVAGDSSGIEEASTAIEEGRLVGLSIAAAAGCLEPGEAEPEIMRAKHRLGELRCGQFGQYRARAKEAQIACALSTETRVDPSRSATLTSAAPAVQDGVQHSGIPSSEELQRSPGYPSLDRLRAGKVCVIECVQDIPCNPCEEACAQGAIRVGNEITSLPMLDEERCNGCGLCIAACPGLAIFVVDLSVSDEKALISLPFEYEPLPAVGDLVQAVDRVGQAVSAARVTRVQTPASFDHTPVVTIAVPRRFGSVVRSIAWKDGV
jgi:thioredoxin reductase/Fe-S-cluster-containing hydrogenase component 2